MKRKFFFFDIDGTLAVGVPGKQYIPDSTKLALKKLSIDVDNLIERCDKLLKKNKKDV